MIVQTRDPCISTAPFRQALSRARPAALDLTQPQMVTFRSFAFGSQGGMCERRRSNDWSAQRERQRIIDSDGRDKHGGQYMAWVSLSGIFERICRLSRCLCIDRVGHMREKWVLEIRSGYM